MNRLAELRKERGLSQAALGKEIGVAQNTLCNWEKGNREIDQEDLLKLANYFKVSIDYLMRKSNYRNTQEVQNYAWGQTSDPFFEAPFDFCPLLKEIREERGVSVAEMCEILSCSKEQYEECEEGILPITYEQAEKLCKYLGTNVSQVLFDKQLYDETVPEEYHDDVRAWEIMKSKAEKEVMNETLGVTENTSDIDIRRIQRAKSTMTENEWSRFMEVAKAAFPKYFSEDFVDDDTDE